ncbi:MAG: periplasmic heavy metal sensor [Verrucomicrobiales bacterium]|nr:periplasmic heavy metal sensor [Verrucomicrobiales bacterium]
MRKALSILGVIALSFVTYCVIHRSITVEARAALLSDCPELIWLKREYSLSADQFEKIQALHNRHDVECKELCRALSATQKGLQAVIITEPLGSASVQSALASWRDQQAVSQDSILKHMMDVSREMDPEQGKRYRENVFRSLILSGRTPHINSNGDYDSDFILHLKQ